MQKKLEEICINILWAKPFLTAKGALMELSDAILSSPNLVVVEREKFDKVMYLTERVRIGKGSELDLIGALLDLKEGK